MDASFSALKVKSTADVLENINKLQPMGYGSAWPRLGRPFRSTCPQGPARPHPRPSQHRRPWLAPRAISSFLVSLLPGGRRDDVAARCMAAAPVLQTFLNSRLPLTASFLTCHVRSQMSLLKPFILRKHSIPGQFPMPCWKDQLITPLPMPHKMEVHTMHHGASAKARMNAHVPSRNRVNIGNHDLKSSRLQPATPS